MSVLKSDNQQEAPKEAMTFRTVVTEAFNSSLYDGRVYPNSLLSLKYPSEDEQKGVGKTEDHSS